MKSLSLKNSLSSRPALAGLSLPWTKLRPIAWAKSPRSEPGAALSGSVAPMICRQPSIDSFAFDGQHHDRTAGDEGDEVVEKSFALMLGIVLARAFAVELHHLHRRDDVTAPFDARRDFADQAARDGVGFADDERTFNGHEPSL